jgi:hypothetical protein
MPTFIKAGFWKELCKPCDGYKEWLNLDQFVNERAVPGPQGPQGPQGPPGPIGAGLFAQTANSTIVTGTTTETTLINGGVGTLTVPANAFAVGASYRAVMAGILNAANNQTIRIKVKAGSVILLDSGAQPITNITNDVFSLNVDFTIRQLGTAGVASIVSLGTFHYTKTSNASIQGFSFNVVNNTTFNTTISNTLDITVQWGSNNAGNSIYSDIFILNKTY